MSAGGEPQRAEEVQVRAQIQASQVLETHEGLAWRGG